jgi:hypothetical protein
MPLNFQVMSSTNSISEISDLTNTNTVFDISKASSQRTWLTCYVPQRTRSLKDGIWRQSKGHLHGESRLVAELSEGNGCISHVTSLTENFHAASSEINTCPESNCSSQPRVNWTGIPALRCRCWDVGMATNCGVVSCRNRRDVSGRRVKFGAVPTYCRKQERGHNLRDCHVKIFMYFILGRSLYLSQ